MDNSVKFKHYAQWLVVLLAIALPFIIIRSFPNFYHTSDMDDFWHWSQAWRADWRSVYINCERCNYPFLGTLLSAGVTSSFNTLSFARLANWFRYYLAAIDALNIFLVWVILNKLQVKYAPLWAGIMGLLPSSWLGSSVWGQIDGAGQLLILLFFILLIWFNREKRPAHHLYLFDILAGLLLSLMLLTKQLVYFSVFALGMIFIANILLYSRKPALVITSGLAALISFLLPVTLTDLTLKLKEPYFSHLQYILSTGSMHGDIISSIGFNIWVFFSNNPLGSSHLPIPIRIGSNTLFMVTPYPAGLSLFLLVNIFLIFLFANKLYKGRAQPVDREFILMSFVYLALVNLSFNLTLTGTHERYLYHFYPFIIIASLAYLNRSAFFNRSMLMVLLAGSLIYGMFLFGYLKHWLRATNVGVLQWMSAFHLILFIYLIYITIRQFCSQTFDAAASI